MEKSPNYKILEFKPEYQQQVTNLVDRTLRDLKIIPKFSGSINNEDLFRITETYCNRGRFWVAINDKTVIGTVAIKEIDQNTAKLKRMYVSTGFHGVGVGLSLLKHALRFARRKKFIKVVLNTHVLMKRAHRFYEKNGFKKIAGDQVKFSYGLDL